MNGFMIYGKVHWSDGDKKSSQARLNWKVPTSFFSLKKDGHVDVCQAVAIRLSS